MRLVNAKIHTIQSIVVVAGLIAPFIVMAVGGQFNINQVVDNLRPGVLIRDSGGIIQTGGIVISPKISSIMIAPSRDSVVVAWDTSKPLSSRVLWGVTEDYESGEFIKPDSGTSHAALIENLSPDTRYYLRVEMEEDGNVKSWFTQTFATLPISVPTPPLEEVEPLARPVPEEVAPEEVAPFLEPEEQVHEVIIGEFMSRTRDTLRMYINVVKGFFLRIVAYIVTEFISIFDQLKKLF